MIIQIFFVWKRVLTARTREFVQMTSVQMLSDRCQFWRRIHNSQLTSDGRWLEILLYTTCVCLSSHRSRILQDRISGTDMRTSGMVF